MGPYAVSADEIDDVTALHVQSFVNGEPRQSAPVKDLIFDIPELIAVISVGITLLPGDIIATGTPAGVGHRVRPAQVHGLRRRHRDRDHRPGRPAQPHRRLTTHRGISPEGNQPSRPAAYGHHLAVEIDGPEHAPVALLVHGLGGTSNFYQVQADALAQRLRVIRVDSAGAGRSRQR